MDLRVWTLSPAACLLALLLLAPAARAEEVYNIGAEDDWYPFTAYRDGQVQGLSVDIVRAAFAASDTRIELLPYPYARCMELTRTGQLAGCFNTSPDARIVAEYRLPSEALFSDDILLWARAGAAPVETPEALAGQRVAVTIGYEYGSRFDNDQRPVRVPVRRDLNGFLMLERGRVDYTVAFRGTAQALFQQHAELQGRFVPVATVHQPQLYLSFSRHHPSAELLQQRFDEGMRRIRADDRYRRILERWHHDGAANRASDATLWNTHSHNKKAEQTWPTPRN